MFWGWLPVLIWVVLGSIFIGAVHDFVHCRHFRNRGQTVGEVAGRLINPRARLLFLLILFAALTVVLAIFGLVIAVILKVYPESALSVWIEIPIAIAMVLGLQEGRQPDSIAGSTGILSGDLSRRPSSQYTGVRKSTKMESWCRCLPLEIPSWYGRSSS